jgi:hypothetical protein
MKIQTILVLWIGMGTLLAASSAHAKTWYDGGYEHEGFAYLGDCSVGQSPAALYNEYGGDRFGAQLIDKGDHVEVTDGDSDPSNDNYNYTHFFWKTKEACKQHVDRLNNEQKQENDRISQYR